MEIEEFCIKKDNAGVKLLAPLNNADLPPIEKFFKIFLLKFSSKNTRVSYARVFGAFLRFWHVSGHLISAMSDIKRSHVDIWRCSLEEASPPVTVAAKLSVLISFLKFCKENGWTESNEAEFIKLPRVEKYKGKTDAFSEEELKAIIKKLSIDFKAADEPYHHPSHARAWNRYCLFLTMCTVGMRASEIVNLRMGDFDATGQFPRLHMSVKGGMEHAPLLPEELSQILRFYVKKFRMWANAENPLFVLSPNSNKKINREYVSRMISKIAKECGIEKNVSAHTCRATVASLLHKNSVAIGEIKELLGHKSIMTTMMYVRKTDEENESAARKNPIFKLTEI
jgi:site-specific recombinase XerD